VEKRSLFGRFIIVGIIGFTLIVVAVFLRQGWITRNAHEQVERGHEERNQIQQVFSRIKDIELGQRGFALSGDSTYLSPYFSALYGSAAGVKSDPAASFASSSKTLWDDIDQLRDHFSRNPQQLENTQKLEDLVRLRVRYADEVIRIRSQEGASAAIAIVQKGYGKSIMDSTSSVIQGMMAFQDEYLKNLRIQENRQLRNNSVILYLIVGAFYILGLFGLWRSFRQNFWRRQAEKGLADSTALLKALVDSTPYAILAADEQGRMTVINKAAEEMLGLRASDHLGGSAEQFMNLLIAPEDVRERSERLEKFVGHSVGGIEVFLSHLPEDPPYGMDLHFMRSDGSRFPVVMSARWILDIDGERLGAVAMANDVTGVRRLEEEVRQSNALLNAVITSTDQAIIAVDLEGILTLYNPAAERMEGYDASEFLGKHTSYNTRKTMLRKEIELRADRLRKEYGREPEDVEVFTLPLKDDPPGGVEWTFVHSSGRRYPVNMAVSPMRDRNGDTIGFMAVIRDITGFKTLEARLRESRARLQAVIDGIDYAIFAADEAGILRLINRGTERILGYSVVDMLGKPVTTLASRFADPNELRARASRLSKHYGRLVNEMELISLPLPDDGPYGQEWSHRRPDGSLITLAFSVYTLRNDDGQPTGVVALARDITQLKALDRMKNEFISTVSHELRTPLTSIRGALGLVTSGVVGGLPEKAAELVSIAHRNSERLVHIINDILDIDKIESGNLMIQVRPLDAAEQLSSAVEANQSYALKYGVRIVLGNLPAGVYVAADPERLMQIMANLLSNAAKFSPQGGEVQVSASLASGFLRISVRDAGVGIPEEFQNRVFEKFAQADGNDSRRRDGTGLGLSITKKLVEVMHGTIGFETETGRGTEFHFELPLAVAPSLDNSSLIAEASVGAPFGKPRILICEDDADVGALVRILLERAGMETDVVQTLSAARAVLKERGPAYSALTLDLMLPDGSGLALLRELRRDPALADLPVIVISAKAEEGRKELNGDAIGMIDWLPKPIDEERLGASLRRAVGSAGRPRILHVEDDADFREVLARSLRDAAEWVGASTIHEAEKRLATERFDLVVLDLDLPDGSGLSLLERLKGLPTGPVPVLILSASEMDNGIRKKVEAALVKSRLSEERIVQTIMNQIRKIAPRNGRALT